MYRSARRTGRPNRARNHGAAAATGRAAAASVGYLSQVMSPQKKVSAEATVLMEKSFIDSWKNAPVETKARLEPSRDHAGNVSSPVCASERRPEPSGFTTKISGGIPRGAP